MQKQVLQHLLYQTHSSFSTSNRLLIFGKKTHLFQISFSRSIEHWVEFYKWNQHRRTASCVRCNLILLIDELHSLLGEPRISLGQRKKSQSRLHVVVSIPIVLLALLFSYPHCLDKSGEIEAIVDDADGRITHALKESGNSRGKVRVSLYEKTTRRTKRVPS